MRRCGHQLGNGAQEMSHEAWQFFLGELAVPYHVGEEHGFNLLG